jgi:L-serine dehydratase
MSISTFDLFKVGIGPSSSHTVGPMVAAKQIAEECIGLENSHLACRVHVELFGSLGSTGKGHGSLKAIVLGLEGELPESTDVDAIDSRMACIVEQQKITLLSQHVIGFDPKADVTFHRHETLPYHPNGMRFRILTQNDDCLCERYYYSIGGGFVINSEQAEAGRLLVEDTHEITYPFSSGKTLLELCQTHSLSIAQLMLANEITWQDESRVLKQLDTLWSVMQACVARGCANEGILPGGLRVERRAKNLHQTLLERQVDVSSQPSDPLQILDWVTLYALAVNEENASGGRVVTAPTNGAAGIIPAVLHYYFNFINGANREGIHTFLLTAAAIGILFKKNASISGAEVGCQGEVGSACSMAAAGLTAVLGGSVEQIENAAEIAMEHHLGLTCDPIGGLVQIPCIERNAVASVSAIHASRMALTGSGKHYVSLDKVINTMRETGKDMLEKYKETSRGGLAINVVEVPVNIVEC